MIIEKDVIHIHSGAKGKILGFHYPRIFSANGWIEDKTCPHEIEIEWENGAKTLFTQNEFDNLVTTRKTDNQQLLSGK
mgnify:CR=1 FL=1